MTQYLFWIIPFLIADLDSTQEEMTEAELTKISLQANGSKIDPRYIRRVKEDAPGLVAQNHPHGTPPSNQVHSATGAPRPTTYGNDNSSVNRQTRAQSTRPDPLPGKPWKLPLTVVLNDYHNLFKIPMHLYVAIFVLVFPFRIQSLFICDCSFISKF